jgi:hypothetical protein
MNSFWTLMTLLTEELLGGAGRLDDLDQTGSKSLDGRNVVGKDAHITGSGRDVARNQMEVPDKQWDQQSAC